MMRMRWIVLATVFLFLSYSEEIKLEVETGETSTSEAARVQLQKIQEQASRMEYGECWMNALKILHNGCRQLTDEMQRRIAYAFTRCHLQASGRGIPECAEDKLMSECTDRSALSDAQFSTYTDFFTHTQQICFHLQSQAWHEATEDTITRLADNSADVAVQLERSAETAQEMIVRQNNSLRNQEILLKNEERLKDSVQQSVRDVQRSHAETKAIINEQRALFSEVFERVAILQKTVLGEFSSIYTFGFYVGSTLLAYILTSTRRTSGARIWLFLILLLNAVVERLISKHYVNELDSSSSFESGTLGAYIPELIYEQTWLCRKIFSGLALLVLLVSVCRYKDYNRLNNMLLQEIKQQNKDLKKFIRENIQDSANTLVPVNAQSHSAAADENLHDEEAGKRLLLAKLQSGITTLSHHDTTVLQSEFDVTLQPADVTKTTVDFSDSGDESDATFRQSELSHDDSECSSTVTVVTNTTRSTILRANSTRRSSTPLRESSLLESTNPSQSSLSVRKSRRRTASILAVLDESISYVEPPSDSVIVGGYSLRKRPQSLAVNSTVMQQETLEQFTSYVLNGLPKRALSTSNRTSQHWTRSSPQKS